MGLRYVGFVGARPSSGAVITDQERREGCFCSHAWLETSVERFIPARRLFLSLLRRSGYLSSVAAWYLGIGADLPYALATVLIPIQHEYMSARRWPVITLGLILINFGVFLSTHWVMDKQQSQLWQVRAHTLILAAMHPQLTLPPEVQEWVADFRNHEPAEWSRMQAPNYDLINEWDTRTSRLDDSAALQSEMDSLAGQYSQLMAISVDQRYGFVPVHPGPIAYLTSTFLHGGWWHLMGNMWFLWLAGFVLEDAWGRTLYLLVYLTAGAFACQFYPVSGRFRSHCRSDGSIPGALPQDEDQNDVVL